MMTNNPPHRLLLLVVFALCILCYSSSEATTFVPQHEVSDRFFLPPTNDLAISPNTQSSKPINTQSFRTTSTQQQCSCPNCYCNSQQCPKAVSANSYLVLSAMEDCAANNQVPAIGLVNIQSTSSSNQFKYGLVDEDNKNKALSGQGFKYYAYKSNLETATDCVSDSTPAIRVTGKAYLIAKSSNLLLDTNVRFNIQMSCVLAPFSTISMSVKPMDYSRFYVGKRMTWSFSFVNQYDNVDTWQKGTLMTPDNVLASVNNGVASLIHTPSTVGQLSLDLKYTPDSTVYGSIFNFATKPLEVFKMAVDGSIEVTDKVQLKKEFQVKYTIKDSDGTVTPKVDLAKLSFVCPEVDLVCVNPTSDAGSGSSVTCTAGKSGIAVILMQFDGKTIDASRNVAVIEIDPNANDNGKYWIDYQSAIVAMLVLAVIVIGIVVIAGAAGIFIYFKRRRAAQPQKIRLSEDEQAEDLEA